MALSVNLVNGVASARREIVEQDVFDEVGIALQPHLFQDSAPVGADRLDAQAELVRNFGHRLAFPDVEEDFIFAVRQTLVRQVVVVLGHLFDHEAGQVGTDVLLALDDGPHGILENLRSAVFVQVAPGSGFDHPDGELILGIHAESEHGHFRVQGLDLLEDLESAPPWKADVEQQNVRGLFPEQGEEGLSAGHVIEDLEVSEGFHNLAETCPDDVVVIAQDDGFLFHAGNLRFCGQGHGHEHGSATSGL